MTAPGGADRAQISDRVLTLLAQAAVLPREDVQDQRTKLREDLGMDSMDFVELINVLERELGQQVEREHLSYLQTVGDVVDLVCGLIAKRDESQVGL